MLSTIIDNYTKESTSKNKVCLSVFDSPVGKISGAADENFLYIVAFEDSKNFERMLQTLSKEIDCGYVKSRNAILNKFESELQQYFEGKIKKFTVPISTVGSDFQKEVWNKLLELPYGSTSTYAEIAKSLGRPVSHARAVGAACGANAHLLVIPCHRVVASNSKGGFSCGIDRKEWLLKHEKTYHYNSLINKL